MIKTILLLILFNFVYGNNLTTITTKGINRNITIFTKSSNFTYPTITTQGINLTSLNNIGTSISTMNINEITSIKPIIVDDIYNCFNIGFNNNIFTFCNTNDSNINLSNIYLIIISFICLSF